MSLPVHERTLVQADRELPGLAAVLSADRVSEILSNTREFSDTPLVRKYIRYKPGMNCLVAYGSATNSTATVVYAKAYSGDFAEKLEKEQRRSETGWDGLDSCQSLLQERVLLRQFPSDGKLRSLKVLRDQDTSDHFFRRLLRKRPGLWESDLTELTYKPERRYVVKVESRRADHLGAAVVKFYGRGAYARTRHNIEYLKRIGYTRLPPLIGRSVRRRALGFEWFAGETFRDMNSIRDRVAGHEAFNVGEAIAELHCQPVSAELPAWNVHAEESRVLQLVTTLRVLCAQLGPQLDRVAERLFEALTRAPLTMAVVHGDFHSKQVLLTTDDVRFLDPDELGVGPPQLDIGTFLAHLQRDALRGFLSQALADELSADFLDGYVAAGGSVASVNAFTALALLRFSHHPFRASEKNWPDGIAQIVSKVLKILGGAEIVERRAVSA